MIELILNLFSVSGGQATLGGNIFGSDPCPFLVPGVTSGAWLRKLVLILRGLRLARVARLAKLVNMPLLQELANIVSGCLPRKKL